MTAGHIATLHFNGSRDAAKKRLQKLKAARLIGERTRHVNEPSILFLTRKGLLVLRERGVLSDYRAIDLPVLDKQGSTEGELGKYIAEQLTINLVMSKRDFSVLDRANLKKILAEHKLTATGLVDPDKG